MKLTHFPKLFTALLLLSLAFVLSTNSKAASRPHIIHILVDDMGWNDVSYHGSAIKTPHIDQLAKDGAELDQFYVQPTCTPTRAAMMTGRYPLRYGLHRFVLRPWHTSSLPLNETTVATQLRQFGYTTAVCGKWHLGMYTMDQTPLGRGFDHQYGHLGGHLDFFKHTYYKGLDWHRNVKPLHENGYATKLIADEAIRLIEKHQTKRPLYLYLPFNAPHLPLQAPKEWLDKYSHLQPPSRAKYAAMVGCLDHHIGRIVKALEASDSFKNTMIIFSSDNGGGATVTHGADNSPLKGTKGQLYEGGIRVPASITWKGVIKAGQKIQAPLHAVDLFPTMIAAAGRKAPPTLHLDGINLLPLLQGKKNPIAEREIIHNAMGKRAAIRAGDWKLLQNADHGKPTTPNSYELYNIRKDPSEQRNLAAQHPQIVEKLKKRIQFWNSRQNNISELTVKKKPQDFSPPKEWVPIQKVNKIQEHVRKQLAKSDAVIDTIEIYGVRINAERRFSYKVEAYREHLFIRVASGNHSGWAEINMGENINNLPFKKRIWRTQWMSALKGMTLLQALDHIISQRTKVHYSNTEAAEMALIDLSGKCLNIPSLNLLQLKKRNPVPGLYAILSDNPDKVKQEAQRALKQNLKTHLKVKLYGKPEVDTQVIQAARSVFGKQAFLIGDVNTGYRRTLNSDQPIDDLLPNMKALYQAGLTCVEDPANLDHRQWIQLAQKSKPLTLCPDVPTRPAWKAIQRLDPAMGKVFNMHPAGMGSLIETARLGHWIQSHQKNLMVGDASLVGPACPAWEQIAIGLGADWVEAIEKPQESTVFQECLISNPVTRTPDGRFSLPKAAPGFGVIMDLKKLREKSYAFISL